MSHPEPMSSGLILPPGVDRPKQDKHRCICGEEFEPGQSQSFQIHLRKCSEDKIPMMMRLAEEDQANGFKTGFDKEKIKYARDKGHL